MSISVYSGSAHFSTLLLQNRVWNFSVYDINDQLSWNKPLRIAGAFSDKARGSGVRPRFLPNSDTVKLVGLASPVFGLYLPIEGLSTLLLLAILVLVRERQKIVVGPGLRFVFYLFIVYLVLFCASAGQEGWRSSLKGSYDILRGLVFFPLGLLLARQLDDRDRALLFSATAAIIVFGNFIFDRGDYFGYQPNPNSVAIAVFFQMLLCIAAYPRAWGRSQGGGAVQWLAPSLTVMALIGGVYLLSVAHSRGVWLGAGCAALFVIVFGMVSQRLRLVFGTTVVIALVVQLYFGNYKGFGFGLRDQIWSLLLEKTITERPWLGFGINSVKKLMLENGFSFTSAHNILIEIFVSSGLVGLAAMATIMLLLIREFRRWRYRQTPLRWIALAGLIAFAVIGLVDLQFASYRFIATISLLLGLLYSQRMRSEAEQEKAAEAPKDPLAASAGVRRSTPCKNR